MKPTLTRLTTTSALLLACAGAAHAEKVNLAYFEDAPLPIGGITMEQIETLAASDFTHVVFAFINLCSVDTSVSRGFTCPGTDPVPVWNIKATYDANGDPFPDAQKAVKMLSDAGKVIYMSVGGAQNPETWDYMAGASEAERAMVGQRLQQFMVDYSITGVDFDNEAGNDQDGFPALAATLAALTPKPAFSSAPYQTDPSASSTISVQWQYCTFVAAGAAPTLINRQYYSGGYLGDDVASFVGADLAGFTCADGQSAAVPQNVMNPGLGVPGQASPPNCDAPNSGCADIGAAVVSAYPDIAGMSLWNYDGLDQPNSYACQMGNALNGTKKGCN